MGKIPNETAVSHEVASQILKDWSYDFITFLMKWASVGAFALITTWGIYALYVYDVNGAIRLGVIEHLKTNKDDEFDRIFARLKDDIRSIEGRIKPLHDEAAEKLKQIDAIHKEINEKIVEIQVSSRELQALSKQAEGKATLIAEYEKSVTGNVQSASSNSTALSIELNDVIKRFSERIDRDIDIGKLDSGAAEFDDATVGKVVDKYVERFGPKQKIWSEFAPEGVIALVPIGSDCPSEFIANHIVALTELVSEKPVILKLQLCQRQTPQNASTYTSR